MDVVETESEAENTFINKLLGEMKNQFNKTDQMKTVNIGVSDDESLSSREYSSNSSNDIQDEDNKATSVIPNLENIEVEVESSNCVAESHTEEAVVIKQDHVNEKTNDLGTTFRKPLNNSKCKLKNSDPNGNTVRKTLRAKVQILEENVVLKRSPRRRSRDYSESILQSAIARKEKSYNEGNRPQRLTRLLKPTPKILENLANAAALKLERNRKDKFKVAYEVDYCSADSESDSELDDCKIKKPKHRHGRILKPGKRHATKDLNFDHFENQETEGNDKCNKKSSKLEDKLQRRSSRLSSRSKDECINSDDSIELPEANIPEEDDNHPDDASLEAQLVSARLCLCTHKTHLYACAADDEVVFCTAMDGVGDKIVGCNCVVNVNEVPLLRPSARVPYTVFCEVHLNRLLRHNCCPKCGIFCTEGEFVQCDAKHQYHRECQITLGQSECCPHCGLSTPNCNVFISMNSQEKPVFLPQQRAHYPPAKMSFCNVKVKNKNELNAAIIPAEIIHVTTRTSNNSIKYSLRQLYEAMKEDNQDQIVDMLGSLDGSLNLPFDDLGGGTLLHYAAQNGMLSIVHLLVVAGADVNVMDKEQNTALISAILGFENNVVNYLIKAGSSTTIKGTDGMTPLHIAAKLGNVCACELLLDSSTGVKDYINLMDDGGWTALVWACEHGHFENVQFLVNRGADVSLRDIEYNTALHWAAYSGNEEIAELLLNNGSDVNVLNVQGDSPLHLAARQDMYNFILILLTRGACVNLVNKAGETALDCCQPVSECYTAVLLNVTLHSAMTSNKAKQRKAVIINDISQGRETNPIQCINNLDDEQLLVDFTYIVQSYVTSDDISINQNIRMMHHCTCETKCLSFNCICCNNSLQSWYNNEGKLVANFDYLDPPMIFECNQICSCNAITCNNRIVQRGITQRFQVFKTEMKGWGVKTLRGISKGAFVCEYVGEIITNVGAEKRKDDCFMFDLDNKDKDCFCIDARSYGNFARFINHGCDPNLVPIKVFVDHHDLRFPRVALFASKNISPNEELSFDYGEKFWLIKYKLFTCKCASSICKYSEERILETVQNIIKD